jgi:hypothetical protein
MSIYALFKTNPELEQSGIELDYGNFKITIARAGGANKKFAKLLEARSKPYKRAIQTETMDIERANDLIREVYAEAVILNWETKINDVFVEGIEDPEDSSKTIPATKENIVRTLRLLPDLFVDIQEQATKAALFREEIREQDAKN